MKTIYVSTRTLGPTDFKIVTEDPDGAIYEGTLKGGGPKEGLSSIHSFIKDRYLVGGLHGHVLLSSVGIFSLFEFDYDDVLCEVCGSSTTNDKGDVLHYDEECFK